MRKKKNPAFRFEGEKENPKCSHLQDIVFMVRLAMHAPSCTANVSDYNAIFLHEECLQNRGLLTVVYGSETIKNFQVICNEHYRDHV